MLQTVYCSKTCEGILCLVTLIEIVQFAESVNISQQYQLPLHTRRCPISLPTLALRHFQRKCSLYTRRWPISLPTLALRHFQRKRSLNTRRWPNSPSLPSPCATTRSSTNSGRLPSIHDVSFCSSDDDSGTNIGTLILCLEIQQAQDR